jgi:glycosyltransferase involved in cell wall biosynthesis
VRVALAITTFERPDALAAVLRTAIDQRIAADEIWVADDGSGDATRAVVEQFARLGPVRHVRQEHAGFRLTRLRNLAIAATAADYLIFIDGDMLLHPDFIDDHRRIASAGAFTQGVRILLDEGATRLALDAAQRGANPLDAKAQGHGLRKLYGVHAPAMQRIARHVSNTVIAIKGCNQAFWRRDLERVNGFNEAIEGWGPEDKELCARLEHAGVRRQTLLFGGIAWHLHHASAARDQLAENRAILAHTLGTKATRCERGLDSHSPSGPTSSPHGTLSRNV